MNELKILSEEDYYTKDISKMSDFFSVYIKELKSDLEIDSIMEGVKISPATINIISQVMNFGVKSEGGVTYVPNFDGLPQEIKKGIKEGRYVLGESSQVSGDVRATLIDLWDKNHRRVKDITLKKIKNNPNNVGAMQNLLTQIQLKQISEKLDCLYDKLNFQILRERKKDIRGPFFSARDYIRDAQLTDDDETRRKHLDTAMLKLREVATIGYEDLTASAQELAKETKKFLQKNKKIREYMSYMCEDMYMINKSIGLQLQIYKYLGRKAEAQAILNQYITEMKELSENKFLGQSAIGLLQDNYPYSKENMNMWFNFKNTIEGLEKCNRELENNSKTYFICAEG